MMSITHAAIAVAGSTLALGTTNPWVLGLAAVASQIPDIDTTTSIAGRMVYPIARWFEDRFPHRTITHSLWATVTIAIVTIPLAKFWGISAWLAIPLGHILSTFSDTFTKEGVGLFYPSPVRAVCGRNPKTRLATGSTAEYWLLAFAIALALISINIQSNGGLITQANQLLGIREGVESLYNKHGNEAHIYVEVQGVRISDRAPINGKYFLIEQLGRRFILQNSKGIYSTEQEILPTRMNASVGEKSSIQTLSVNFNDEEIYPKLEELYSSHTGSAIYLSGQLSIDAPEEVTIQSPPGQLQTAVVTGATITLLSHPLEKLIGQVPDQFGTGQLTAKVIYPAPSL